MKLATAVRMATAGLALVSGLAFGNSSTGRWVDAAASATARSCSNYQLLIQPVSSNSATGHVAEMFRIHNLLPGSCTLVGYPGAMLLDRNFYSLPTHVVRSPFPQGGSGPALVSLDRAHNAYFVMSWVHFPTPGQTCPIAPNVMFIAPNDRLPVVTNGGGGGIMACGGNVTVSPVAATTFWS